MSENVLKQIAEYFGYESTAAFAKEWRDLTAKDKADLKKGFEDGTMNY